MSARTPLAGVESVAPTLSVGEAAAIASDVFGEAGAVTALPGFQEQNFCVGSGADAKVLKIAARGADRSHLDLQNRAMERLAAVLSEAVPVALRTLEGDDVAQVETSHGCRLARLLRFVPGTPLQHLSYVAPAAIREAGRLAGRVASALAGFDHPAAGRAVQWDVAHACDVLAAVAPAIGDLRLRDLVLRLAERAAEHLEGLTPELRVQVIHGDLTCWNLLATSRPDGSARATGVIDFGDTTRSWLAGECAVLAASLASHAPGRPLQPAALAVAGFHEAMPLSASEIAALPALVAARAALSAAGTAYQARLQPSNAYVLQSLEETRRGLEAIASIPFALAAAAFRYAWDESATPLNAPRETTPWSPLLAGHAYADVSEVDLSVESEMLEPASWSDPASVRAAIAGAVPDGYLAVGRHGEARVVHEGRPRHEEPATVHLGMDLFVPAGAAVASPCNARVLSVAAEELVLRLEGGSGLRLAGLWPEHRAGQALRAGVRIGVVAPPAAGSVLPSHLHVQLLDPGLESAPGLVPPSLREAWLAVCPDPRTPRLAEGGAPPSKMSPKTVLERRRRHVAAAQRLYYEPDPPRIERGWREWLFDADGRRLLDMVNNVAIVGHCHPRIEAAAGRQMRRLNTNSRFLYDAMGRLAERLAALSPDPLDTVFLVNSGSEANDLALRLARAFTGNEVLICFEGTYHGWTAEMTATGRSVAGTDRRSRVQPVLSPAGSAEHGQRSADHLRATLERLIAEGKPPAAFIAEPVLGNAGGVLMAPKHLQGAYTAIRSHGGVCIADEVQVGYARLGHHFWAFEQQGVVPDIVTLAKATGNGYPVAAVITTRAIADAFGRATDFFSSVGGSPASCEVALAVLDVVEDEGLQDNARVVGDHLAEVLAPIVAAHPLVKELHGMGLYRGLELEAQGIPAAAQANAICRRMLELAVVVQPTGPHHNILKLKPPLCIEPDSADFFAGALQQTLAEGW